MSKRKKKSGAAAISRPAPEPRRKPVKLNPDPVIRVVRKRPGYNPEIIFIDNTLEALQAEVGGYVEPLYLASDACLLLNEEGVRLGLEENGPALHIFLETWRITPLGTVLLVGCREGDFADLPDARWWASQCWPGLPQDGRPMDIPSPGAAQ